jgi:hypothetical protein
MFDVRSDADSGFFPRRRALPPLSASAAFPASTAAVIRPTTSSRNCFELVGEQRGWRGTTARHT